VSRPATLCAILLAATLSVVGCNSAPVLASIQVIPNGASLTTIGETVQFKAIGTYQRPGNHPATMSDITSQVVWTSSEVGVSTIGSSGLATATGSGSTTILASVGAVVGSSSLTVSAQAVRALTSIEIIPASGQQTVTNIGESNRFIAIGTYTTSPMTVDLTDQVSWQSSNVKVSTVNSAGLALGNTTGTTTITAIGKSNSGADIAATSVLTVTTAVGGVVLPGLTIYSVGLGTGTVTSADGVINCTSVSGAVCIGNFVFGTAVTLTATPATGSTFGGWSSNCISISPNSCQITMNNNEPVGAIFN
jgi:List-Bact-rpt repeat protein/Big-like domain-containing protein